MGSRALDSLIACALASSVFSETGSLSSTRSRSLAPSRRQASHVAGVAPVTGSSTPNCCPTAPVQAGDQQPAIEQRRRAATAQESIDGQQVFQDVHRRHDSIHALAR